MYLISVIYSEGLENGRECVPMVGDDVLKVSAEAYTTYQEECRKAREEGNLESHMVGFEEFYNTMQRGFDGFPDLEYIQLNDSHIQFEAKTI